MKCINFLQKLFLKFLNEDFKNKHLTKLALTTQKEYKIIYKILIKKC